MKILHFLITSIYSGAEKVALSILKELSGEHEVFYCSPDGEIKAFVQAAGISFIPLEKANVRSIRKAVRDVKPDVIHAHDPRMSFLCSVSGIKFHSHLHSNCPWLKKLCPNSLALLLVCKRAENVICVSDCIASDYIFENALRKKLVLMPNTIDITHIKNLAAERSANSHDIVFVGRFVPEKQPLLFVDFVKKLSQMRPGSAAVMVGDGDLLEEAERRAEEEGVNIEFTGFLANPFPVMASAKINVVTSSSEGFGLAAVESMALGLPVLTFPVGGLLDFVDNTNGAVCTDISEMALNAVRLLDDAELYKTKSINAKKTAEKYGGTEKYTESISELYKSSL